MKTNFEPRSREIKGGLSVGGGENLSTCLLQQTGGGGGKFGWIEFDKRVDSLTQVPSGFGYGVAVLEIGLSRQRLGGREKVPETVSSGITVFTNYLLSTESGRGLWGQFTRIHGYFFFRFDIFFN